MSPVNITSHFIKEKVSYYISQSLHIDQANKAKILLITSLWLVVSYAHQGLHLFEYNSVKAVSILQSLFFYYNIF